MEAPYNYPVFIPPICLCITYKGDVLQECYEKKEVVFSHLNKESNTNVFLQMDYNEFTTYLESLGSTRVNITHIFTGLVKKLDLNSEPVNYEMFKTGFTIMSPTGPCFTFNGRDK